MNWVMVLLLMVLTWASYPGQAYGEGVSKAELQQLTERWQNSSHALADVNCTSCHQDEKTKEIVGRPTHESCQSCHQAQVETFLLGKHGIRLHEGESTLTPALAHLPMKAEALNKPMNCNACHDVHSVNTRHAAVEACLSCHNDTHSLNYKNSQHAKLLFAEGQLPRPSEQSTTCATCHLPRQTVEGGESRVIVNHNNTFTLKPRDRMVKEVCMNCHGMEYAYNSIFDDALVESNFARPPTQTLETLEMIYALENKRSGDPAPE